ncbi:nuclear cap-binding protein subunit 3-like [Thrips palmi]|uniref:Nuclear cap-binding protein subunit 3 n=1 Tax=Thrips palmi TaxID=161013 RepID=A0A6P9A389_THRPL|nr:nuclear cap-binding protein subunit 3-like [Thrips palmi]
MDAVMEVDESAEVAPKENPMELESEEGELSDDDGEIQEADVLEDASSTDPLKKPEIPEIRVFCPLESDMKIQNRAGGFITGIDVFGKEEQARLVERAKRFGLDTSQSNLITEHSLKKLYRSVGVKEGDDKEFKFDSLQMHGTEAMSTQDVFEYFKDYAPTSIEWINDESCNVVWLDNLSAIRALLGISKPIKNLNKLRDQEPSKEKSPSKIKKEKDDENKSGEDSDVIMIEDEAETAAKQAAKLLDEELAADPEAIDALELNMHIPPGQWRKGDTHPNSDGILLRFCPRHPKTREDGPKRLPQPVFGMVGLVSKSRKQRIKEGLLVRPKMFHDDMGDERDFVISSDEEDGRNPWGTLAKSWSNIDRSRRPPAPVDDDLFGPRLPPGLPPMHRMPPSMPLPPHSILNRIGVRPEKLSTQSRRKRSKSRSHSPSLSPIVAKTKSAIHARLHGKRRKRDEDDSDDSAFSGSESDNESWSRKSKIPRMRMYADEEEVKVKERTKLQARRRLGSQSQMHSGPEKSVDLRDRLGRDGARHGGSSRTESSHSQRWRSDLSDRVVRSERVKSHSRPKPTVKSVASSVWSRLSTDRGIRIKHEEESSASDSEHSDTTSSSQENLQITRTLRDESDEDESSQSESDSSSEEYSSSEQESEESRPQGDLRSRLGFKQASSKSRSRSKKSSKSSKSTTNLPKQRSPLRIEIDNDEYYRSQKDNS